MSISKISLADIKEAVLANTARPTEEEDLRFTQDRFIRCSQNMEGNSQVGIILFAGVAKQFGFPDSHIMMYASIEREQLVFKLQEFREKNNAGQMKIGLRVKYKKGIIDPSFADDFDEDVRFAYKVILIKNYLKLMK